MSAYAYLRKSSVRDMATDMSPETQEREVRALAKRHGDTDLTILADWDISGRGQFTKKRAGYQQLLAAIDSGQCSAVYSYSLSRLGRSVHELTGLFERCKAQGVSVRLVADSVDTSTASGVAFAGMLAVFAQFEADVTSERMRAMFETKRARGERVGTVKTYGEKDGEDVDAVLAAVDEAGSFSGGARLLNERGIRPRTSRRGWWASSVQTVYERAKGTSRPFRGPKAIGPDFILAKLLKCPTCGTLLTGLADRDGRKQGPRIRYACRQGSVLPHPRMSVTETRILGAIKDEAERLMTPDEYEAGSDESGQRLELENRRARVLDMYESSDIDRDEYRRRVSAIDATVAKLDSHRVLTAIPGLDWTWPPRQINAVLRALFESIELDPLTFEPTRFEWTVPEWRAA